MAKAKKNQENIELLLQECEVVREMSEEAFRKYMRVLRAKTCEEEYEMQQKVLNDVRDMDDEQYEAFVEYVEERGILGWFTKTVITVKEPDEEQNGMMTAFQYGHRFDGIDAILKKYPWVCPQWLMEKRRFHCPDKVVATMVCHPEDIFDKKEGERLVLKRLNKTIEGNRKGAAKVFEQHMRKQFK